MTRILAVHTRCEVCNSTALATGSDVATLVDWWAAHLAPRIERFEVERGGVGETWWRVD